MGKSRTRNVPGMRNAYSKRAFERIIDRSSATTALAYPIPAIALPTTGVIDTEDYGTVKLVFLGGSADAQTFCYQAVGWYAVNTDSHSGGQCYLPMRFALGTATLGTGSAGAGGVGLNGLSGDLWADTLTDSVNMAGTYLYSRASNDMGFLEIPVQGASVLEVETDITTGKWLTVFAQLGEPDTRRDTDV